MKPINLMLAFSVFCTSGLVFASEDLAKSKNCLSCHTVANKLVGPAFKDVAAKYKGDKKAPTALATKIKVGGKGVWGEIPMPPNNLSDSESKQLASWILSIK